MTNRRHFLAGLLATGLAPVPSWADAGSPAYLSAAARPDGTYVLCGISDDRDVLFQIPLPARGHAAAAHPTKPFAVAFARRPGTFAFVIDCTTGQRTTTLNAPQGRHFYGHGVFSTDGSWLYTTENDFEAGQGRVGIWDVRAGYVRSGEVSSGGIGPHDIKRLPGTDILVIANGGIDTHPDSGRTKLNIATMAPNLAYMLGGQITEVVSLAPDLHKNSIRHLAVSDDGTVAFGMQWQGDTPAPPLAGLHQPGTDPRLLTAPDNQLRAMQGYVGSIAFAAQDTHVIATSPRGGIVHRYDVQTGLLHDSVTLTDASGVAPAQDGVVISTGTGQLVHLSADTTQPTQTSALNWDNHLVQLRAT
jgi:hypothetical protein